MSTFVEARSTPQIRWMSLLLMVLTLAGTNSGIAQTQQSTADHQSSSENNSLTTEGSGTESQSAAELAKQASNPLSSGWLMQTQQNSSWVGMPSNQGDRVQSQLLFQPLVNVKLTDQWTLFTRPILTLFNSTPYVDPAGLGKRTTGFGVRQGALVFQAKQCRNCHAIGNLGDQRGPSLDSIASRMTEDQIIRQVLRVVAICQPTARTCRLLR